MTEDELRSILQLIIENKTTEVQHVTERGDGMSADQTAKDFVKLYLELYKEDSVKDSTYQRLSTSYKAMLNYPISNMKISDITHMDIQKYVKDMTKDGYAKNTIKKNARVLTAALKFAAANRIISYDPTVGIKFPRQAAEGTERDVSAYSVEEQKKLIPVLKATFTYFSLILQFILETGLRVGEAIALDWTDIDLKKRSVSVTKTDVQLHKEDGYVSFIQDSPKTHSSIREVPLTDAAMEILRRCGAVENQGTDRPVFRGRRHERINYNGLREATKRYCAQAGVPYKGTHVFRHTFATNAYRNGIDIKRLSRILGHASVQVTYDTYINLFGDGFDDLMSAMEEAFGKHAQKQG